MAVIVSNLYVFSFVVVQSAYMLIKFSNAFGST